MPGLTNFQRSGQGIGTSNLNRFQGGYNRIDYSGNGRNPTSVIGQKTANQTDGNITSFPSDLPPIKLNLIQCEYTTAIDHSLGKLTSKGLIQLPVPLSMNDPHRVIFNDGYSYLGTAQRVASSIGAGIVGAVNTPAQAFGLAGGEAAGGAFASLGFALNSFRGVTIEQPQFKNHQMTWKFSPKSAQESIQLQKILYNLKKSSALRFSESLGRFLFTFPDIFVPFFSNAPMMYKFKPCVLTAVDVDYVGGNEGPSFFHETKAPESVVVQLSFLELEYWVRQDFERDEVDGLPSSDPSRPWNWNGIDDRAGLGAKFAEDVKKGIASPIILSNKLADVVKNGGRG